MKEAQLNEILEKHKKWLNDEPGGERANLWRANLRGADLQRANLWRADLQETDLWGADLRKANLQGANLRGADLQEADLRGADLQEADLWGTNFRGAYLQEANLRGADLRGADLWGADLWGADLWGADLQEANLQGANLQEADNIPGYVCPICCPEEGSFVGFKRAYAVRNCVEIEVIIELEIPAEAKRSSATNRKCRCNKAKVLSITDLQGIAEFQTAVSLWDIDFVYEVGKTVVVDDFDDNRWNECSTGIHFFITRDEAVNY